MTKIIEINCTTGVEIVRDMTEKEIVAYELQKQRALDEQEDEPQAMRDIDDAIDESEEQIY